MSLPHGPVSWAANDSGFVRKGRKDLQWCHFVVIIIIVNCTQSTHKASIQYKIKLNLKISQLTYKKSEHPHRP